jgi:hypothetical protein
VPLFDRAPDGAVNGIILFDIYYRGAFVGCQRTWAQASAYVDFLQSDDNLFCKAAMNPFRMMTFYKDRLVLNEANKIDYVSHPTDSTLVIGANDHTYAAAHLPESGWQYAEAWEILDQLKPDSIPINVRMWLAGIIASALDRVTKERSMSAIDLRD